MRKGAIESSTFTHISSQIVRSLAHLQTMQSVVESLPPGIESQELQSKLAQIHQECNGIRKSIDALEEERQSFHALVTTGRIINSSLERGRVMDTAMDTIIELTGAERGFLMLREDDGRLRIQVARDWERATVDSNELAVSQTVINRVVGEGVPILTTNAQEDPRFSGQDSIMAFSLRSIMCVPLLLKQKLIGVIYVDNRIRENIFTPIDLNALQAFANMAAVAIENARLFNSLRHMLEEVTELKNLMDSVFQSMTAGLLTIDSDTTILLANPAAGSIFQCDHDGLVGKNFVSALPLLYSQLSPFLQIILKEKKALTGLEIQLTLQEEREQYLRLSISPLFSQDHEVQGMALLIEDETETRRLQAQRRLFERMVAPAVISQIDPDGLNLAGRRVVLTTLFADVRGFSSFSESNRPEHLFAVLNAHLRIAVDAILHQEGTIDKFQGDAIMAWFNAPLAQTDHPLRAVRAALGIMYGLYAYHQTAHAQERLMMGIGIHTGEAALGLVGTEKRMEYTAIGDSVNIAKRLQENALPGQILISDRLYRLVKEDVAVKRLATAQLKGKQHPVDVYEVVGLKTDPVE
jgi:adenylate cyclase